jgi:hypothetical protein
MSAAYQDAAPSAMRMADEIRHVVLTFFRALDGHPALEERLFAPTESAAIATARKFASGRAGAAALRQIGSEVEILCQFGQIPRGAAIARN